MKSSENEKDLINDTTILGNLENLSKSSEPPPCCLAEKTEEVLNELQKNNSQNQITTSPPIIIDHRLSLSSISSLNSGLKSKCNNLNSIINELDKEYNKTKTLNTELHINTNVESAICTNEQIQEQPQHKQQSSSSNTSTLSANSLSDKDLTNNNYNFNNTITCRYRQFDKKRNSNTSTTTSIDQNEKKMKNIYSPNPNVSNYDFGTRINSLRFIDDSASSTALTSPAESLNHCFFGQQQHRLLNSSNYKNSCPGSNSTSSSRTMSLSASTNVSSCCSTPIGTTNKRVSLTNREVNIKRQENVKSSTDTLSNNPTDNPTISSSSYSHSTNSKHQIMQLQHQNLTSSLSMTIYIINYF